MDMSEDRHVRATYTDDSITVYQAYPPQIADAALTAGTFVSPFKQDRMTWIKPSFLWMMYRSGWATKPGQERSLAVEISRDGFEWALAHACLSHFDHNIYTRIEDWQSQKKSLPVRVQRDPERSITLDRLQRRTIQVGLSGEAVERYIDRWILSITDATELAKSIHAMVAEGNLDRARAALPKEQQYHLPESISKQIAACPSP